MVWCINYYICAAQEKKARDRFFAADAVAKAICLVFFIIIPTTNVRPEIGNEGFWDLGMKFLYWVDSPDNLFPSIHCIVSWLCWIGVRGKKDVHIVYRYFSLVMAIAVCVSTVTTRQHVIADVIGGVLIAEISYFLTGNPKISAVYVAVINFFKRILRI